MATKIKDFLKEKNLPSFLAKNKTLLSFDNVSKVFPGLGLTNCKENTSIDCHAYVKQLAINLLYDLSSKLCSFYGWCTDYNLFFLTPTSEETRQKLLYQGNIAYKLYLLFNNINYESIVQLNNGKFSLKLHEDLKDDLLIDKVIFKKNESIFKIYNKVCENIDLLQTEIKCPKLEDFTSFKLFSSHNLPKNTLQIAFSSDGVEGLWDIATMSMRGIKSCQSWEGRYKLNLIGSIVNPFVGIIYLTSNINDTNLGSKMVRRSIVRFAVNSFTGKPFIFIDRMYPEYNEETMVKFKEFIEKKIQNKFQVLCFPKNVADLVECSYIPETNSDLKLTKATSSYKDTKIPIGKKISDKAILENSIKRNRGRFINLLKKRIYIIDSKKISRSKDIQNSLNFIVNSQTAFYRVNALINSCVKELAIELTENVNTKDIISSDEYMKRLCFHYMNNKNNLSKKIINKYVKKIHSYYELSSMRYEINSRVLFKIIKNNQHEIDSKIKKQLVKIISKQSESINIPG